MKNSDAAMIIIWNLSGFAFALVIGPYVLAIERATLSEGIVWLLLTILCFVKADLVWLKSELLVKEKKKDSSDDS